MIEQLFVVTAVVSLVVAVLNLVGANLYDLRAVRRQRQLQRHPYSRQNRQRPLVSVIIATHNDERLIKRCLSSLAKSSYRKYEILIVDQASADATKSLVKQFSQDHPARSIRLIARRTVDAGSGSLIANYKKYGHGELVLLLEASDQLDRQALVAAVRHFNAAPTLDLLSLNRQIGFSPSLVGFFQKYQLLLRYRAKKFASLVKADYNSDREIYIHSRQAFLSLSKPAVLNGDYASDVIVYSQPQPSFYQLLRGNYQLQLANLGLLRAQRPKSFRLPLVLSNGLIALALPLLVSYFIYIAISLREPSLLILSWASLGGLLLLAIWGDEHLRWRQKTAYSALLPVTYGLFYVLSFVPLLVSLRALIGGRRVSGG